MRAECQLTVWPSRLTGGLGNTVPIVGGLAREAFRQNCSALVNSSRHAGGRLYKFEDFFDAPKLIPRKPGDIPCAVKALTSRPKASVVESVRSMHAELRTEVPPAWSDAGKLAIHCNNFSARRALVVLHLRTGWADVSANAAEIAPHNLQDCQLRERSWFDAADQVFSLMLAPNFGNLAVRDRLKNESLCAPTLRMASRPCGFAPTLTRLLENVVHEARTKLGTEDWSIFVAADAPGTRERAVAHLRQMGITAAHSHGQVGHNNAWATARIFGKDAALRVIDTALVDLLLLSHADMVVTSAGFSTFPKAADMMSVCSNRQRHMVYLNYRPLYGPIQRALFVPFRSTRLRDAIKSTTQPITPTKLPHCLRDCFNVSEWAYDRDVAAKDDVLLHNTRIGNLATFSVPCIKACACFFNAAYGGPNPKLPVRAVTSSTVPLAQAVGDQRRWFGARTEKQQPLVVLERGGESSLEPIITPVAQPEHAQP